MQHIVIAPAGVFPGHVEACPLYSAKERNQQVLLQPKPVVSLPHPPSLYSAWPWCYCSGCRWRGEVVPMYQRWEEEEEERESYWLYLPLTGV